MGVAGHHRGGVLSGFFAQHPDQIGDQALQGVAVIPQGQPDIQGHLVVPAAAGVETLARVPDPGGKGLFHKGVDVLGGGVDFQGAAGQVVGDGSQSAQNRLAVLLRDNALTGQHGGVDTAALHVLGNHPLVEPDGGVKIVHTGVNRLGKAAFPELFCHEENPFSWLDGKGRAAAFSRKSGAKSVSDQTRIPRFQTIKTLTCRGATGAAPGETSLRIRRLYGSRCQRSSLIEKTAKPPQEGVPAAVPPAAVPVGYENLCAKSVRKRQSGDIGLTSLPASSWTALPAP